MRRQKKTVWTPAVLNPTAWVQADATKRFRVVDLPPAMLDVPPKIGKLAVSVNWPDRSGNGNGLVAGKTPEWRSMSWLLSDGMGRQYWPGEVEILPDGSTVRVGIDRSASLESLAERVGTIIRKEIARFQSRVVDEIIGTVPTRYVPEDMRGDRVAHWAGVRARVAALRAGLAERLPLP